MSRIGLLMRASAPYEPVIVGRATHRVLLDSCVRARAHDNDVAGHVGRSVARVPGVSRADGDAPAAERPAKSSFGYSRVVEHKLQRTRLLHNSKGSPATSNTPQIGLQVTGDLIG